MEKTKRKSPWSWVPSLYYAQGIPYVVVMTVSVIMYKRMGVSNTDIALYTSWLYLPWVIKPFWSPIVDLFKTKRWWIVVMQLLVGAGLAGVALTLPLPSFLQYSLAFLWLLAFSSATHDIAADGFYMLGLDEGQQSYFVGIRSTFYRLSMITGQGLLIILAGFFEIYTGQEPVKLSIDASPQIKEYSLEAIHPDISRAQGLTFVLSSDKLELSTAPIPKHQADSLKIWVDEQNLIAGFVIPEPEAVEKKPSWWSRTVAKPLGSYLKRKFAGETQTETLASNLHGNLGIIGIRLSENPGTEKEIVLNTSFKKGDASIKIANGERLVFNSNNWDKTAWLLFAVDHRLDKPAAAHFEGRSGNIPLAWSITFALLAALFLSFFVYHKFFLPRPATDYAITQEGGKEVFKEFFNTFYTFFTKENIFPALGFLLLFRLGEAQLVKMASPFMLDARQIGGLGLTTGDVGLIYGTIGILALTAGGIIGGIMASRKGLKFWILPMTFAINLPNLTYVYLSWFQPENFIIISSCVAIEQFGYGFGFTAYMLFMIYFAAGKQKTAHFAICTGLMALGMMIPGMFSGWVQEIIGYQNFFIWVMICTIPGFLILRFLKIDKAFGIKENKE